MTQSNEWIKVKDYLPETLTDVLIWNGKEQSVSLWQGSSWFHEVDWYDYDNVTHWKHSEPPKE